MLLPLEIPASALLLVDVQRDYLHADGAWARRGVEPEGQAATTKVVEGCQRLIRAMHQAGRPVIFALTHLRADRADWALPEPYRELPPEFLVEGSWGAEVIDGLDVSPQDFLLSKKGLSAFQHTHLDRLLANLGVRHCLVAGGTVTGGLADTVRTGAPLGYELFIVSDAVFPADSAFLQRLQVRADFTNVEEVEALAARPAAARQPKEGAPWALVVVDMQNDFLHPKGAMRRCGYSPLTDADTKRVIDNNRKLAAAMRARGWSVIFAKVGQRPDGLDRATDDVVTKRLRPLLTETDFMHRGTWGSRMVDELEPEEQDIVIEKQGHSSFGFTPLHRVLRNLGVVGCYVTGGAVTGCVSDTVREGIGLGYPMKVISDATYPPESAYLEALASISEVCSTEAAIAALRG